MNSELRGIIEKTFTFDEFCIELHKADAVRFNYSHILSQFACRHDGLEVFNGNHVTYDFRRNNNIEIPYGLGVFYLTSIMPVYEDSGKHDDDGYPVFEQTGKSHLQEIHVSLLQIKKFA